ncbi:WXG100 family type VII secretion target [Streptomyces sioyaensis]|uniref:WXG100 family type VII secretion target n=1 Tax=Streptomyces sioyaensis TaxID=67364 RepID=UPI0037912A44
MSINSYIVDKVVPVLELFTIPWPGGDPTTLRAIAGRWQSLGQDLHQAAEHLNGRVDAVVGVTWHGDAADAFKKHWKQQYDATSALGPEHEATRVLVADDRVFSALIRPEVIGRPQLSGRHLRLDGNMAVAWAKGEAAPNLLVELAVELNELVGLLPRG